MNARIYSSQRSADGPLPPLYYKTNKPKFSMPLKPTSFLFSEFSRQLGKMMFYIQVYSNFIV